MGRPTKLTKRMKNKIVKLVKQGVAPCTAAVMAGIGKSTYTDWMRRGRDGEPLYSDFSDAIEEAEAVVKAEAEMIVRKAFTGVKERTVRKKLEKDPDTNRMVIVEETRTTVEKVYPQYALAWLERKAPDEWGQKKPSEQEDKAPESVSAGPAYTDPWLETDDE